MSENSLLNGKNVRSYNSVEFPTDKEPSHPSWIRAAIWGFAFLAVAVLVTFLCIISIPLPIQEPLITTPKVLSNYSRVIVVGDVHGNLKPFNRLLEALDLRPNDVVVLAGDMTTKGPDSMGVLRRAMEIGALCVRGNHDHTVIRWRNLLSSYGESKIKKRKLPADLDMETEHYQLAKSLPEELFQYLESSPVILSVPRLSMYVVHAGFNPFLSVDQQKLEEVISIRNIVDGEPTSENSVGTPWWKLWNAKQSSLSEPTTVVYGHTASLGLNLREYSIGLDSGCGKGKKLSAMIFPEHTLVQVKC
ncbi:Metallo-dependent phosphatase [Basidiobolus meristosporus CBS 931.73]|uniref:Metallo-dependent phosphatase n=1 Tax=Basidiobolus meristosporus CBS 931.73 TaxID=1314790 RepID=A0A1Y1YN99_9FUNG|nr:Metallo-dependent phosphatase [Basidiobolus meristosporus CBS 931.73]|eukprot:ORX99054.1 Metallo-dependent phosphatase [Basidiobolus meristosporus CBS 931.73]